MSELVTIVISAMAGGAVGFLTNVFMAFVNRNKNAAETVQIIEETNKARLSTQAEMQKQIKDLVLELDRERDSRDKERDAKREELNRIYDQLATVQSINSGLITQVGTLQKLNVEKDARIKELESLVDQHTKILRKTGQLPARNKL